MNLYFNKITFLLKKKVKYHLIMLYITHSLAINKKFHTVNMKIPHQQSIECNLFFDNFGTSSLISITHWMTKKNVIKFSALDVFGPFTVTVSLLHH